MAVTRPSVELRLEQFSDRNFRFIVLGPALALLLAFGLLPVVYNLVLSLQDITMQDESRGYAGFLNYRRLFEDARFWQSIAHTLVIAGIALPIQLALGLALAQLFSGDIPGKRVFVALMVLPTVISPIVAGASWRLMFDNQFGPVNQIIGWFSGTPPVILWTTDPAFVYPAILILEIWAHTPFVFLLLYAALSQVDRSLIESAEIDGASAWTVFRRIVLPSIRPVLLTVVLIRFVDLMRLFDFVYALTQGGPGTRSETVSMYAYVQGFQQFAISFAAAVALFMIVAMSAAIVFFLSRVKVTR